MFLFDPDAKPETPIQNLFRYLAGFGLLLCAFEYGSSYLRQYMLRPRYKLPYALKDWAADDEFYEKDEQYVTIYFNPTDKVGRSLDIGHSRDFKPDYDADTKPIVGKWSLGPEQ